MSPSLPSGLMARFGGFIERAARGISDGLVARPVMLGGEAAAVGAMAVVLWRSLAATLRRLAALHARFAAGKLPAAPRRRLAPRPVAEDGTERAKTARVPALPPGPVLLTVFRVTLAGQLRALLEDPEMRALLAAGPEAGRLLRPLWRKLSAEPLPEMLRLPPRPPRPRKPRAPRPAQPAPGSGPPGLRRVRLADGTRSWEPIPCYPFGEKPPRLRRARADEWLEPEPAPPAPSRFRPPPARPAPRPPDPERRPGDYRWIGRLFMR